MLDSNDLATGIVQAQQSFSSYYILGYYSSSPAEDGRYRRVEVKLKSPEKYKLEYRAGYYAPKTFDKYTSTDKERQLEEALASEIRSPACRWRSRSTSSSAAPRTATSFRPSCQDSWLGHSPGAKEGTRRSAARFHRRGARCARPHGSQRARLHPHPPQRRKHPDNWPKLLRYPYHCLHSGGYRLKFVARVKTDASEPLKQSLRFPIWRPNNLGCTSSVVWGSQRIQLEKISVPQPGTTSPPGTTLSFAKGQSWSRVLPSDS